MNKRASFVLNLSDALTRRPLPGLSDAQFSLDGKPALPVYKAGGWFVFINLPDGEHVVSVRTNRHQEERVRFALSNAKPYVEEYRRMKPGERYAASRSSVQPRRVAVTQNGVPCGDTSILLLGDTKGVFKIAEDDATERRTYLRLFIANPRAANQLLPGRFFIKDAARSEVCAVRERAEEDMFALGAPLLHAHKRGIPLCVVEEYWTDQQGEAVLFGSEEQEMVFLVENKNGFKQHKAEQGEDGRHHLKL